MAKRTPLYEWHVAQGARMVDFASWDMPVQYTSIVDEHQAVRTSAGLFDISHMGRLVFEGADALDLIQHVFTNDAASMKPGQARYGLICNAAGGILDDVLVYRYESFWMMVVNASNREKIVNWIDQQRGKRTAQVTDKTFEWAMLAIQGPKSPEVTKLPSLGHRTWSNSQDIKTPLKYYFSTMSLDPDGSVRYIVSRTGYTGEAGYELIVPSKQVLSDLRELTETFAKAGVSLKPCGLGARDTLRLEAGMPLYGHELNEDTDPIQAGLAWAVKMDKGDFIGREALLRRSKDTALPIRIGLELEGKRIAREGSCVLRDGVPVGRVTSGTFSPTLEKAIAMAYVDRKHGDAGTPCEVDVRGKPAPARVVPLPFYRKTKS
jgi:aminomethyltransferase